MFLKKGGSLFFITSLLILAVLWLFTVQLGMACSTALMPAAVRREISIPDHAKVIFESYRDSSGGTTLVDPIEWNALLAAHAYSDVPFMFIDAEAKNGYQVLIARVLTRRSDRSFVAFEYLQNPFRSNAGYWKPSIHLEGRNTIVFEPIRKVFDPFLFAITAFCLIACHLLMYTIWKIQKPAMTKSEPQLTT